MTKESILKEFNDDAWYGYHHREFKNQDEYYDWFYQWIDNRAIYYSEARKICEALNYDIFQDHEIWGRADDWSQGAYAALNDYLMENSNVWDQVSHHFEN